ncbi:MAG: CPBP family intramembrane metalloprotease [Gammaproteobacteria bacterium]|nr:CPBP family intramembrane metalloprotease [Gammaproteobacteria bacterium]
MTSIKRKLHRLLTYIYSVVLLILVWYLFNPFASVGDLGSLRYIGPSAGRLMETHMEFYAGYDNTGILERKLHNFLFGSQQSVVTQAIHVYDEVLKYYDQHPDSAPEWGILNTKSRRLIVIAEKRDHKQLREALKTFDNNPEEEVIAEAVRYAYLPQDNIEFSPEIFTGASLLPVGWASDQLRLRIAMKLGDNRLASFLRDRIETRGAQLRLHVLQLALTVSILIGVGLFFLVRYRTLFLPSPWERSILNQPWSAVEGFAVTVRAAVYGLLIFVGLHLISTQFFRPSIFTMWSTLFASLPMLLLIHIHLLKPRGLTLAKAFGLSLWQPGLRQFFLITLALLAMDMLGQMLIGWGTWKLGLGDHWAAGIQEKLVFGPQATVIWSTINIVLWTPIMEEIGFRGLVYTTLRSRLGPTLAIVVSATLFSALHLKSVAGFLSIFWSGLLLAYAYERYHSLLPGIVMHSVGNLLYLGTILLFYR